MAASRWRARARHVITEALVSFEGDRTDEAAVKKYLSDFYPFGPRNHHPYKIWLDEVAKTAVFVRRIAENDSQLHSARGAGKG